jgi:regulator of protease activity HflC (stomatin/prohibitin superfamily)
MGIPLSVIVFLVLFAIFVSGLRIAREYQRAVVFRLGRYNNLRGPGLFWLIPLGIENETRIDLRVVTNPIEQQETITRDSVTVKVNAVLWFRVSDPKKAVLTVENFRAAVQQVALTSLRNVIGQHDLDEVLKERDKINALLNWETEHLPWGIWRRFKSTVCAFNKGHARQYQTLSVDPTCAPSAAFRPPFPSCPLDCSSQYP